VSAKNGVNINTLFYKDIFEQIAKKFNLGNGTQVEDPRSNLEKPGERCNINP
jgi:hypothetical protein